MSRNDGRGAAGTIPASVVPPGIQPNPQRVETELPQPGGRSATKTCIWGHDTDRFKARQMCARHYDAWKRGNPLPAGVIVPDPRDHFTGPYCRCEPPEWERIPPWDAVQCTHCHYPPRPT